MRNTLLAIGLAYGLVLPAAQAQAPSWTGAAQNTNPAPTNDTESEGLGISTDAAGNAYVGGALLNGRGSGAPGTRVFGSTSLTSSGNGFGSGFIAKLSTSLQWQWAVRVSNNGEGAYISHVAATPAGDVYASGDLEETSTGTVLTVGSLTRTVTGTRGAYITRLNTSGVPQWIAVATLSGATSTSSVTTTSVSWDAVNSQVVVVGEYLGGSLVVGTTTLPAANASQAGIFVARLNAAGQWVSAVGALAAANTTGSMSLDASSVGPQGQVAVAVTLSGSTLTLGSSTITSPTPNSSDVRYAVAQLSPAGQWQWVAQPQTGGASFGIDDMAYGPNGTLWLYGEANTGNQFGTSVAPANAAAFVAGLSATGQWGSVGYIIRQATSANGFANASQLTTDAQSNAVVTGGLEWRSGTASLSFGTTTTLTTTNTSRNYVARFSPAGQWQYAQFTPVTSLLGTDNPYGFEDLAIDGIGNMLTTGRLRRASVGFDVSTLTGSQTGDAYVAKLSNAGALLGVRQAPGTPVLTVYPNPAAAGASVTLHLPAATAVALPVVLRDALGRAVCQTALPAGRTDVAVATTGLAPGLYLLEAGASRAQVVVE
jgi:hypothetical protein